MGIMADHAAAMKRGDWNLAVRRAQEALEVTAKGAILLLGGDPPKTHSPAFINHLRGMLESEVARNSRKFPAIAAGYLDEDNWIGGTRTGQIAGLLKSVGGAHTMLGEVGLGDWRTGMNVDVDGSTVAMYLDGQLVLETSDTTFSGMMGPKRYLPVDMDGESWRRIAQSAEVLHRQRDPAFYREITFDHGDARDAGGRAVEAIRMIRAVFSI